MTLFKELVKLWIEREKNIPYAYYMGGGWERWAQGQICIGLMSIPDTPWARCEVLTYDGLQRADIVFQARHSDHWDIVELKCCKFWEDTCEDLAVFLGPTRVGLDIRKVVELPLRDEYRKNSFTKWAIGLFCLRDVRQHFKDDTLDVGQALEKVIEKFPQIEYVGGDGNLRQVNVDYEACEWGSIMVYFGSQG